MCTSIKILLVISLTILFGCGQKLSLQQSTSLQIVSQSDTLLSQLIKPYSDSLAVDMSKVVARNPLFMDKSRPCSPIHNWSADAVLVNQTGNVKLSEPVMVLLNHGGFRSALVEGDLTVGDFYQFMPFENHVVWCRMPAKYLDTIAAYIQKSGGEPIAGVDFIDGKLSFKTKRAYKSFWVITSDYLANGGDYMRFFEASLERINRTQLLRDVFISEAKKQGQLKIDQSCRTAL